jgi:hypothetical protein
VYELREHYIKLEYGKIRNEKRRKETEHGNLGKHVSRPK